MTLVIICILCIIWVIVLANKPAARERRRQMYGDDSFLTMIKSILFKNESN
jgi:hypothetical protein